MTRHRHHILHVVPGLGAGGMELAMAGVVKGLTGSAMEHAIVCLKGRAEIRDRLPIETVIHCLNSKPNEPQLPFRLARLVRQLRPDVIHARNWGAWPDIAIARLLVRPLTPFIFSFHGLGEAGYMPWRRRLASAILVHLTSNLFTVSKQSKEMLVKYWGWPKHQTEIIPNGVDTKIFQPHPRPNNKRPVIGSVGNLRSVKNHALILKACSQLVTEGVDLEIRIAGEGDQREPLTSLAQTLGLTDRLYLPGRVEDIPGFLNGLDVFVLSSDSEQHPNALNEALACGVPSVATRVGCAADLLDGGRCGRIIRPGQVHELTDALRELAQDRPLRHALGEAGMNYVRAHFSLDVMVRKYHDLYLRAARRKYC